MTDAVSYEQRDGVALVHLEHPPANPLSPPLIEGLHAALDEADRSDARVFVIASSVPRFFAAGADIKHMASIQGEEFAAYGRALRAPLERIARSERPSIAAIEGRALGGGLELALACTLRVAGRAARFGLPEARLGMIPAAGGTQRLPALVGRGRALDLILTAREIDAEEALAAGLVDRLADEGQAEATALELAAAMSALSAAALASTIRCVARAGEGPLEDGLALEAREVEALRAGPDAHEGIAAFIEKRAPRFA
jgi:enoyl-CoA hydratase